MPIKVTRPAKLPMTMPTIAPTLKNESSVFEYDE
jgi:hypothetical protein